MMLIPIQNTGFEKRCLSVGNIKTIELYLPDSCGRESIVEVGKIRGKRATIAFDGERCDSDRARQMASALQLAAAIANDFDTWFEED